MIEGSAPVSLSVQALHLWMEDSQERAWTLLDVREVEEYEMCHLEGATLVPLSTFPVDVTTLRGKPVVVYCHHGVRSYHAGVYLKQAGVEEVYNLEGGIEAWACEIDTSMPRY